MSRCLSLLVATEVQTKSTLVFFCRLSTSFQSTNGNGQSQTMLKAVQAAGVTVGFRILKVARL